MVDAKGIPRSFLRTGVTASGAAASVGLGLDCLRARSPQGHCTAGVTAGRRIAHITALAEIAWVNLEGHSKVRRRRATAALVTASHPPQVRGHRRCVHRSLSHRIEGGSWGLG